MAFSLAAFACACFAVSALLLLDVAGWVRLTPPAREALHYAFVCLAVVALAVFVAVAFLALTASPAGVPRPQAAGGGPRSFG